jgi:hypothetical protein
MIGLAVAVAVAALAALVFFRTAVVQALLLGWLAASGVSGPELVVEEVELDHMRIADLRLGRDAPLRAARVTLWYDPRDLVRGTLGEVEISGLRASAEVSEKGVSIAGLEGIGAAPAAGRERLPIAALVLADAQLQAATPLGPVTASFDGRMTPDPRGPILANIALALTSPYGEAAGRLNVSMEDPGNMTGRITIEQGRLDLPFATAAALDGDAAFGLRNGRLTGAELRLTTPRVGVLRDAAEAGRGAIDLLASYGDGKAEIDASLHEVDDQARATLNADIADLLGAPKLDLAATGEVTARSALWNLLSPQTPASGRGRFELILRGSLSPPPAAEPSSPSILLHLLQRAEIQGSAAIEAEGVGYGDLVSGLEAKFQADVAASGGEIEVTLPSENAVKAERVTPALLKKAGLPLSVADQLEGRLAMTLKRTPAGPFRLAMRPSDEGLDLALTGAMAVELPEGGQAEVDAAGTFAIDRAGGLARLDLARFAMGAKKVVVAGHRISEARASGHIRGGPDDLAGEARVSLALARLQFGEVTADEITVSVPTRFAYMGKRAQVWLAKPGSLRANALAAGERLRFAGPLEIDIVQRETPVLTVDLSRPEGPSLAHDLVLHATRIDGEVLRDEPLGFRINEGKLALEGTRASAAPYRAKVDFSGALIEVAALGLAAEGVDASSRVGKGASEPVGRLRIAKLSHLGQPPLLAQMTLTGTLERRDGALAFTVQGTDANGVTRLNVAGSYAVPEARGEADVEVPPLTFSPGGLQPKTLFPRLADLAGVSGTARAKARLRWGAAGLESEAEASLERLSFMTRGGSVQGLTTTMRFKSLFPPVTPPGQELSVERVDFLIPLSRLLVRFQLESQDTEGRIHVERARAGVVGGEIGFADVAMAPAAPLTDVPLEAARLDLEQLFRLINVEGLRGTGKLSGRIPVTLSGENLVIRDGRLAAEGEGVIRYRPDEAARALGQGGESVDLMLRALEDFHYQELALSIDKEAGGEATIAMHLLGHNPAVLEGHPFKFNINLSANVDSLLAAVLEGYRTSQQLMRRALAIQE